ncbi:hypothetical protein cyc_03107 [Cyclospora cayetanensis]|uniref:Uncharacterized protein n=1 Tax=Cyclospora cayetanensis TaxID=88456 RepID=A0A1D3D5K0_9EIME|nr:hypothetical protein cyc_03107 [Cyclospora cayetanensis]
MQQQEEAAGNAPWGSLGGLAMRLTIGGPRQLRRSGAVYLCSPGRVYVQWLERWLLLDGFMLKCFSSCNSLKPKTTIPLESAVVEGEARVHLQQPPSAQCSKKRMEAQTCYPLLLPRWWVASLRRLFLSSLLRHSPYLHCAAPTLTAVAAPAPAVSQQASSRRLII